MLELFLQRMKDSIGDNRLSLSGEILITNKDTRKILVFDEENKREIKKTLKIIADKYQFMKVGLKNGLNEVTIKFFAHEVFISDKDFLDMFCNDLKNIISQILENDDLLVRANVFGSFETIDKIYSYRYLNRQEDVQYKIVDEDFKTPCVRFLRPKVYLIAVLIGIMFLSGWQGYEYYKDKQKNEEATIKIETSDQKNVDDTNAEKTVKPDNESNNNRDGST